MEFLVVFFRLIGRISYKYHELIKYRLFKGGLLISITKSFTPAKLGVTSLLLLLIGSGIVGFLILSLDDSRFVQNQLTELFQNDPKVQREMTRPEAQTNSQVFATDVVEVATQLLFYPFYLLIAASLLSAGGLLTIKMNRFVPAMLFSLAGVLSLFTLLPPALLFFASSRLFATFPTLKV